MSRRLSFGLLATALAGALASGCNPTGNVDMGPQVDPLVRFAHYVDALMAVDICVKGPNDADFVGPITRTKLMRPGGVPFGYTSGYMSLPPARYTLRIIVGSRSDCTMGLPGIPDIDTDPVAIGRRYTVAGMGNWPRAETLRIMLLEDDNSIDANQARVRFIHAVPLSPGSLDFGSGSGSSFAGLATAGSYAEVAEGGGQPYVTVPPATMATYSVRQTGSSTDLKAIMNKVTLEKGQVYTATLTNYVIPQMPTVTEHQLALCKDTGALDQGLIPCEGLR
jgi:hypothetical protein